MNDDDVEVNLMRLLPADYETLTTEDGIPLTALYPSQMYVLGINGMDKVLEIAGYLTPAMKDLAFDDEVE